MTQRHHLRARALAAAVVAAIAASTAPAALATPSRTVVLRDVASDANGLNDGAEGFAQGFQTTPSIAEADVRTVDVAPLRNGAG